MKRKPLNERQRNVLEILRTLPRRYRHQQRPGAAIRYEILDAYDRRTVESLIARNYFVRTEYGLAYAACPPDLWIPRLRGPYTAREAAEMLVSVE